VEDKRLMGQAKSANESRGLVKNFKNRHSDLNQGTDMRDNSKIMDKKGKDMMNKMKNNKSSIKTHDKSGKRLNAPKT